MRLVMIDAGRRVSCPADYCWIAGGPSCTVAAAVIGRDRGRVTPVPALGGQFSTGTAVEAGMKTRA